MFAMGLRGPDAVSLSDISLTSQRCGHASRQRRAEARDASFHRVRADGLICAAGADRAGGLDALAGFLAVPLDHLVGFIDQPLRGLNALAQPTVGFFDFVESFVAHSRWPSSEGAALSTLAAKRRLTARVPRLIAFVARVNRDVKPPPKRGPRI
jgi:hypothetical protein